ncbi:MAG: hypothetical protein ACREL3_02965 [Gemmatimonadales bacterium]
MSKQQRGDLQAQVGSIEPSEQGVTVALALTNTGTRTLHYIGDVRAIQYDAATRTLRVQLSDRGRPLPPGGMAIQPRFRTVDPGGRSELALELPRTIVRMVPTATPGAVARLEEVDLTDAQQIEVEIGWSPTPYYPDPRPTAEKRSPFEVWEEGNVRVTERMGKRRR